MFRVRRTSASIASLSSLLGKSKSRLARADARVQNSLEP